MMIETSILLEDFVLNIDFSYFSDLLSQCINNICNEYVATDADSIRNRSRYFYINFSTFSFSINFQHNLKL
jgi:hypothetical protein